MIVELKMSKEELPEFINSEIHDSPKGCQCSFVPLDEKWALKCYSYEDERDGCWKRQKIAEKYELGPKTGQKIFLEGVEKPYCYVTEIVEEVIYCEYQDFVEDGSIEELIENIREIFDKWDDCWYRNLGIKNSKLICIDFGMMGEDY